MTAAEVPSEVMRSLGIVQQRAPILHQVARPFSLPDEWDDARRTVAELDAAAERISGVHNFAKGTGIAAPQIGISRAAAIVHLPERDKITLLNPVVVKESPETDEQYEGCLSFFDVRGLVPRPLALHVEHWTIDGHRQITIFERGAARLAAHEIDHLNGLLYTSRMRPDAELITIAEYRGIGHAWQYGASTS